jgi:hypothetical protein
VGRRVPYKVKLYTKVTFRSNERKELGIQIGVAFKNGENMGELIKQSSF